jgi:hypothetical protein
MVLLTACRLALTQTGKASPGREYVRTCTKGSELFKRIALRSVDGTAKYGSRVGRFLLGID